MCEVCGVACGLEWFNCRVWFGLRAALYRNCVQCDDLSLLGCLTKQPLWLAFIHLLHSFDYTTSSLASYDIQSTTSYLQH